MFSSFIDFVSWFLLIKPSSACPCSSWLFHTTNTVEQLRGRSGSETMCLSGWGMIGCCGTVPYYMWNQDKPWQKTRDGALQQTTAHTTQRDGSASYDLYCHFHLLAAANLRKFEPRRHNVTNAHVGALQKRCLLWGLSTFLSIGFKSVPAVSMLSWI